MAPSTSSLRALSECGSIASARAGRAAQTTVMSAGTRAPSDSYSSRVVDKLCTHAFPSPPFPRPGTRVSRRLKSRRSGLGVGSKWRAEGDKNGQEAVEEEEEKEEEEEEGEEEE